MLIVNQERKAMINLEQFAAIGVEQLKDGFYVIGKQDMTAPTFIKLGKFKTEKNAIFVIGDLKSAYSRDAKAYTIPEDPEADD